MKESNSPVTPNFTSSAELLTYIELNRNVMHLEENYPSINVDEVFNNSGNFLLLDIREKAVFVQGHIEGAKNVVPKEILTYLKNADLTGKSKIVIVGLTGQDAAYVTCLLRLAGYDNSYYLNYGMGYWNKAFSDPWVKGKGFHPARYYNSFNYSKKSFSTLPEVEFQNLNTIEEKVESRLKLCFEKSYDGIKANLKDTYTTYFDYGSNSFSNCFVICYGPTFLYSGFTGYGGLMGHPASSVLYDPFTDFLSTTYLQTLPLDIPIIIYSLNGQQSAYLCAYLQFLGYDARNIDFGAWSLWGTTGFIRREMPGVKNPIDYFANDFTPYGYWLKDASNLGISVVRDYPFVTGE
jgi:rhodanese-related sulfurtransferase